MCTSYTNVVSKQDQEKKWGKWLLLMYDVPERLISCCPQCRNKIQRTRLVTGVQKKKKCAATVSVLFSAHCERVTGARMVMCVGKPSIVKLNDV